MTNEEIQKIALANGFKLKAQPDGSMALNPYVFEFARALVAAQAEKCNAELKKASDTLRVYHEETILLKVEIDALKSENFMLTNERDNSRNSAQYLINEKRVLRKDIAWLRKDAERFAWFFSPSRKVGFTEEYLREINGDRLSMDGWREAIDAAMKETK